MKVSIDVVLEAVECSDCGMQFYMTQFFQERRRADHKSFYCLQGHSNYYPGKSKEEKLRDDLAAKEAELRRVEHERDIEKTRAAQLEKKSRTAATRTRAGVCPCCNRTFKALAAHMKNKHPEVK